MRVEEGTFTNSEGLAIFYRRRLPPQPKAALLISHGLGEHCGRYSHMAAYFVEHGVAVFALDHQGHGRSGGKRGHVRRFGDFSADLEQFRRMIEDEFPSLPVVLFGHSLGGLIAFDYALSFQQNIKALILSAPSLGLRMKVPAWQKKAAAALLPLMPSLTLNNGLDAAWLSHDPEVVNAYRTDPLVHPKISLSLYFGMTEAAERCLRSAAELKLPFLLIVGSEDPIVSYETAHEAFERIASIEKKEAVFPKTLHETHNDFVKQQEFETIRQWLDKVL